MNTKETHEVFAAIAAGFIRYKRALADGHMSYLDLLGFLHEVPAIRAALENIHLVGAELLDLKEDEVPVVAMDISVILSGWGVSHRQQDISGDVVRGLTRMIPHVQAIIREGEAVMAAIAGHPPSALPA